MKLFKSILLGAMMLCFGIAASAQVKVAVSNNNFNVKVLRCAVMGENCVVDMLFENLGSQDMEITTKISQNKGYDDMGNVYNTNLDNTIFLYIGDMNNNVPVFEKTFMLLPEIPVKMRAEFKNISEIATMIKRLDLLFSRYRGGGMGHEDEVIKISNIPITR